MKVVAKPIDMITYFTGDGEVKPIRFRLETEDKKLIVVRVDHIISVTKEKMAGNYMFVFVCQSTIGNETKLYELKYDISTCRWILFKI